MRVNGKLIRRSLETHVLTVAKLKLSDFLQNHRRLAVNKGQSVKGEVIIEIFRKEIEDDQNNKPRTKLYKQEVLIALKKTWPELYSSDIARVTQKDCNEWAARHGKDYSPTRFNGALGIVRRIFALSVEYGSRRTEQRPLKAAFFSFGYSAVSNRIHCGHVSEARRLQFSGVSLADHRNIGEICGQRRSQTL
ncbi:MAG: hypothetical protein ACREFR_01440 [Limisphaerales bacterium]